MSAPQSDANTVPGVSYPDRPESRSSASGAGRNRYPSATAGCRCGAQWGGLNTAHCSAEGCHRTFTSVAAFDAHRVGPWGVDRRGQKRRMPGYADGTRHCADPTTVGLVDAGRAYPCWGFPSDGGKWWE